MRDPHYSQLENLAASLNGVIDGMRERLAKNQDINRQVKGLGHINKAILLLEQIEKSYL